MHTLFRSWLHLPFPLWSSRAGASIPGFFAAFVVYVAFGRVSRSRARAAATP